MDKSLLMTVLPVAIIGVAVFFRIKALKKEQPLDLKRIWLLPAIVCGLAFMTFRSMPPDRATTLWAGVALLVGGVLGWLRGKTIAIRRDPATGALTQKPSILGLLLVLAILAVKFGAKTFLGIDPSRGGAAPDAATMMFTDILLAFAVGLLVATQAEITLRARRLMGQG